MPGGPGGLERLWLCPYVLQVTRTAHRYMERELSSSHQGKGQKVFILKLNL